jgi:Ni,Fe-hydrogenase maturation factor
MHQTSTHHTSPEFLLHLAEEVYGKRPARAYCVTITGDSFELQETLSDAVRDAIPRSAEQIKALLFEFAMPGD